MDENKAQTPQPQKASSRVGMRYLAGFIFLAAGLALWWIFRTNFIGILKGLIGPLLAFMGIIVLAIAKA